VPAASPLAYKFAVKKPASDAALDAKAAPKKSGKLASKKPAGKAPVKAPAAKAAAKAPAKAAAKAPAKAPARAAAGVSFAALRGLGEEALEGVGAGARGRLKKLLAGVKREAQRADPAGAAALVEAVEALLSGHEGQRAQGVAVIAAALAEDCKGLPAEHPLWPMVGRATLLQGIWEFHARRVEDSLASYGEAASLLGGLASGRAFELWSYAMQQRVRLLGCGEGDEAGRALDELAAAVGARFDAYARNRVLEATSVWVDRVDRGAAPPLAAIRRRAGQALALSRAEPNAYTWEFVLHLLGRKAMTLRFEGRHEEALGCCREALPLASRAATPRAREHAAWALAEGAFVAADLLERPSDALPFIAALRSLIGRPGSGDLASELGYGVAMEARCQLLLGRLGEARAAIGDVLALESAWPAAKGLRAAVAAVGVIEGDVLHREGRLLEAHDAWRAVIARFASDPDDALTSEVARARRRMAT